MKNKAIIPLILAVLILGVWEYMDMRETASNPGGNTVVTTNPEIPNWKIVNGRVYLSARAATLPAGVMVDDNLNDVAFCQGNYKSREIMIGNVEIVSRISDLLGNNKEKSDWLCGILIPRSSNEGGTLKNGEELFILVEGDDGVVTQRYELSISLSQLPKSTFPLIVDFEKNEIRAGGSMLGTIK